MLRLVFCLSCVVLLSACGDPLRDVPRLAEVELQDETDTAAAVALPAPEADERPLFARLLGREKTPEPSADVVIAPDAEAAIASAAESSETATAAPAQTEAQEAAEPVQAAAPAPKKPRLGFGLLRRAANANTPEKPVQNEELADPQKIAPDGDAVVTEAAYEPEEAAPAVEEKRARRGLFSRRKAAVLTGPDALEIAPGTALQFGKIARVCKIKRAEMGREVERSGRGKGKFRLHDSAPGSTSMRAFYITGFDDGCPRQVTAALAVFATAESHEAMRYGKPFEGKPYSETDKAYEKVKRAVCRAKRGQPCGDQVGKLAKSTAFITVYDRFGGAQNWHNILLHDGSVLAMN